MQPRRYALMGGIVMIVMAVLAFVPSLSWNSEILPPLKLDTSYGQFLGIFPMNVLNKLALLIFGVAGVAVSYNEFRSLPYSILWSRAVFVFMGIAAVLGLIPSTSTVGGYWPLFGYEVLPHAIFAVLGAYFGYRLSTVAGERIAPLEGANVSSKLTMGSKNVASTPISRAR
jgi:hypothetical protein